MFLLVLTKIADLLIDAFYLLIWAAINSGLNWLRHWAHGCLLRRGIDLQPSNLAWFFYWFSEGLFGLSTLVIIVLYAAKDLKNLRLRQHEGFTGVRTKFVDMWKQTSWLAALSVILIVWTASNLGLEKALDSFSGNDASFVTGLWHFAAQLVFAAVTLLGVVAPMYDETAKTYRRLFATGT
jgi:hypothetical protein